MSVIFRGYSLEAVEGTTDGWKPRTGSYIAIGKKDGCRYQMKCYKAAPYPLKETPMSDATRQQKIKRARDLYTFRKEINAKLKTADGRDRLLGYAEEVFLNETSPANGVVEAVAYIEGAQDYSSFRGNTSAVEQAFLQIAEAVSRMHNQGIIHTDIKPDNMVFAVDSGRNVHGTLIDFDKCCYFGNVSEETGGTFGFQAPELISMMAEEDEDIFARKCSTLDQAIDIFALGASFLLILTGKCPQVLCVHDDVYKVEWDRRSVSSAYLAELLDAMMAPNPGDRPDADAVVETLKKRKFISAVSQFELWPEHQDRYIMNPVKESIIKRVSCEEFNGEHGYEVVFRTGDVRHYTFNQMKNAFILKTKQYSASDSPPTQPERCSTPDGSSGMGKLKPEDEKKYVINTAAMMSRQFAHLIPVSNGYEVEKTDGTRQWMDLNDLLFYRIIAKKS